MKHLNCTALAAAALTLAMPALATPAFADWAPNRPVEFVVASGAGGGTLAYKLAPSGKRILILERGDFLPDEPQNADAEAVFVAARYRTREKYQDAHGRRYRPGQYYHVGGHTKFYGTAMFRFRESDFQAVAHEDGISPAWPVRW